MRKMRDREREEQAMKVNWKGVIPAITTPFNADLTVDDGFLAKHSRWLVDEGSVGLVPIGSLGESATLCLRREAQGHRDMRQRGGRPGARDPGHRGAVHGRGGGARPGRESDRLQRPDGAAAVRLQHRLARDEGARSRGHRRDRSSLHALQQPDRLQDGLPAGADRRARRASIPTCMRSRNRAPTFAA